MVFIPVLSAQRIYAYQKEGDSVKTLQSGEVLGRTQKSFKSDYSFFGTKTETPMINIPQSISAVTKELISNKMAFTLKDAALMPA